MKFETTIRNKFVGSGAKTPQDLITALRDQADHIEQMVAAGVTFDMDGTEDDYTIARTNSKKLADQFEMDEAS